MNKRLQMLKQLTASGKADSFAWYALAMEYRKEQDTAAALATFEALRNQDPDYLPMYLMAGQLLLETQHAGAREWLEAGIELARTKGDAKALGELEDALDQVQG